MKKKYIIIGIIFLLFLLIGFLLFLNNKVEVEEKTDAKKFSEEYTQVSEKNAFVYRDAEEIIKIMQNGTGVVYLGFPECPWCQTYVKYLDEVAKEVGVDKIYYYNIYNDRKNNTNDYRKIVSLLGENLQFDEEGNLKIFVPNVSFHVDGEIIGNDYETSLDTAGLNNPDDYWNEERISNLKSKLKIYMEAIKKENNICTDCNK